MMKLEDYVSNIPEIHSDKIAVQFYDKKFTFREVNERINRLGNSLLEIGIKRGDRIAILANNCNNHLEVDFAAVKFGFVYVPLGARLSPDEITFIINDSGANTLFYGDCFRKFVESMNNNLVSVNNYLCVDRQEYEDLILSGKTKEPTILFSDNDLYRLHYTSGTTGKPKGAMISRKAMAANATNYLIVEPFPLSEKDALLHVAPLTHCSGTYLIPYYSKCVRHIIMDRFDIPMFLKTIQEERVTKLVLVPTMINMLINHKDINRYDLSSVTTIQYGASPMPVEVLKKAIGVFGNVFQQFYGLSEAYKPALTLKIEDHIVDGSKKEIKRLSSAGKPHSNAKVKILNDNFEEVMPGNVGEICVAGEHIMSGYWKNKEETDSTIIDGWVHTGDLANIDEDGFVYIVDRKKDLIISGGFNVYSQEVENYLYQHQSVLEAAVIGVPHDKWGELVTAVVVVKEGMKLSELELIDFCKKVMGEGNYKRPRDVIFVASLPKTSSGKIKRALVKKLGKGGNYFGKEGDI